MDEVEEFDNKENFTLDSQVLLKAIKFRRSIRSYRQLPVEQTKINSIVNAGRYTATAVNSQDCCFIIVQDKLLEFKDLVWEELDLILQEAGKDLAKEMRPYALFNARRKKNPQDDYLFRNAPSVVFIASDYPLDAGLAAQNMELMAVSEGLGMLYNGYLVRAAQMSDKVKKWLEIGEKEIYACMLLGYPDVVYKRTAPRRQASTIFK